MNFSHKVVLLNCTPCSQYVVFSRVRGRCFLLIFSRLFSVCNITFMVWLRKFIYTEKANWVNILFRLPCRAVSYASGSFLPWYFFCVTWRPVLLNSYSQIFRKWNEIVLHFSLFFLVDSLEYLDFVLQEIKDMAGTVLGLTLKETTLSEQGV